MRKLRLKQNLRIDGISSKAHLDSDIKRSSIWADSLVVGGYNSQQATSAPIINKPAIISILLVAAILLMALFWQLFNLQIVEGERMLGIAEGNRVRQHVDLSPRGRIVDRNGVVLASNTASFQLSILPHLLPDNSDERQQLYQDVTKYLDITVDEIEGILVEKSADYTGMILIAERIDRETALILESVLPEHGAFSLSAMPIREYKSDAALSHILGYVGRVSQADLDAKADLYPLDFIGKSGIEAQYDDILRGSNGVIETEVDSSGRPLRTIQEVSGVTGRDVVLSIDYELQKQLKESLEKYMKEADSNQASGVVMDVNSGDILASVSLPAYDNNLFAKGIEPNEYQDLVSNSGMPMFNRVISAGYPTGSTIKPITLTGALENNVVDENTIINDVGRIVLTSQYDPSATFEFASWNPNGLGPMDARSAIAMSSNIYFYTVAGGYQSFNGMGISALEKTYRMFGLGARTNIDIPGESTGMVPSPAWKEDQIGEAWFTGDTYNLAIGQGFLSVSPLQLARAYAAIVNGGKLIQPRLNTGTDTVISDRLNVDPKHFKIVQEGMLQVLSSQGTASPAIFANVNATVAGKSGTAETNPEEEDSRPHAWFGAYAPYENPEIVSVVMLEEGENGTLYAAPVISEVFAKHFGSS
ncbi:MAG: penicillin-binding protein 2 [Candidatus Saccharimonadales bacterium]